MRSEITKTCAHCRSRFAVRAGEDTYRAKRGIPPVRFCGLRCAGLARRQWKPKAQKVAEKAAYDREYRAKNLRAIKAKKRAHYIRTFDPEKMRAWRSTPHRKAYHRAYIQSARYRRWKCRYDLNHRASDYGPFAEAYKALLKLQKLILRVAPDKYERLKARGYYENRGVQKRKRNEQVSRW
jgi:hypothetical protein